MKIRKQKNKPNKKVIVSVALLLVLLIAGGIYYLIHTQQTQKNDTVTTQTSQSDKQQAKNLAENPEDKQTPSNTDTPAPIETDKQTDKGVAQMTVSANISNATLFIRGGIDNAVVSDGSCYAQLAAPSGESTRKDTTLLQNPSTTDCKTISVNTDELAKGGWSVTLHYSSASMEGASDAVSFEIK